MNIFERSVLAYQQKLADEEAARQALHQEYRDQVYAFMGGWGATLEDELVELDAWKDDDEDTYFVVYGYEGNPNGLMCKVYPNGDDPATVEGVWAVLLTDGEWPVQHHERLENIAHLGKVVVERQEAQQ